MDAIKRLEYFLDDTDLANYSFDPTTGEGFDAVGNPIHAKRLHRMFSNSRDPLYIIAITNNKDGIEDLEPAYEQVVCIDMLPLFGGWTSQEGYEYGMYPIRSIME